MTATHRVTFRPATPADRHALVRLALLDDTRPLRGDVLIAEVGGEPVAALETASGRAIADPFRPTEALVRALAELAAGARAAEPAAPTRLGRATARLRPALAAD